MIEADAQATAGAESDDEVIAWRLLKQTGSRSAREQLFFRHQPFARKLARRHFLDRRGGDIEFNDLCQLAYTGLLEAIDRFDPERGAPFQAYASARVSGSIRDGVVKVSEKREQIAYLRRVRRERVRSLAGDSGEKDTLADAVRLLGEIAAGLALGFMLEDTALYVAEDRAASADAYEGLVWKQAARRLMEEVDRLPEREQIIVRHHYIDGISFETIAALLGLSKGRISQIHRAAIELLHKRLRDTGTHLGP